ncbi:hypothetical protein Tco_0706039 [Tanacetum coccineum]|uniref:Uncharacterized protein n=1 Tax=Tanacetum coccineum TaxID=301880 RepID=A0ABQ4Y694_9ASTR
MSDSEHSTVTYTLVSIPVEDDSDIGSPGVDGPPIMPEDPYAYIMAAYQVPPSPDYIPGPEEPQSPPLLDFVPEPMYPEYIPQEDEILSAEEQPLPAAASPTADLPGYVPESDPEEEPEEDDKGPEEDPADYPTDRDDDDEEEEEEPFGDDADDEDEDKDEDEEEEEHPARSTLSHLTDRPEITLPPRKRLGIDLGPRADYRFVGTMDTEIRRRRAEEVSYRIRDVWIDPREAVEEVAPMTLGGVNARVTELTAVQDQDTQDIYD